MFQFVLQVKVPGARSQAQAHRLICFEFIFWGWGTGPRSQLNLDIVLKKGYGEGQVPNPGSQAKVPSPTFIHAFFKDKGGGKSKVQSPRPQAQVPGLSVFSVRGWVASPMAQGAGPRCQVSASVILSEGRGTDPRSQVPGFRLWISGFRFHVWELEGAGSHYRP